MVESRLELAPIVMDLQEWKHQLELTNYPKADIIWEYLVNGVKLGNDIPRTGTRVCGNLPTACGEYFERVICKEMLEECRLGRRAGPFDSIPLHNFQCSPLGTVPKKDPKKLRVIHHLSYPRNIENASVNSTINDIECKLVKFSEVLSLVQAKGRGCLMAKYDIRNAFRLIRVRVQDQHLLGMLFQGKYYYELCLPFGLKSAPGLFELFATAIEEFIHRSGVETIRHYIDDYLTISFALSAQSDYDKVIEMFKKLNIELASEKLAKPSTRIEFLGLVIDSDLMKVELPQDKLGRYKALLDEWLKKEYCTLQELQSLVGKLVFASYAIQHGHIFYRRILGLLKQCKGKEQSKYLQIEMNNKARLDIKWWREFIYKWNGTNIIPPCLDNYLTVDQHLMFTDACRTGMGAFYNNNEYIRHAWNADELKRARRKQELSVPYLELLALTHSINVWAGSLSGKAVILNCDCNTVVQAVNRGRSYDPGMMNLIRILLYITSINSIFIHLRHIEGVKNIDADLLSRSTSSIESEQYQQFKDRHRQTAGMRERFIKPLPTLIW
jgi:hypothetical protein